MSKFRKTKLNDEILKMEKKYFMLVWYARRHPEDIAIDGARRGIAETEFLYPEDVEKLRCPDTGDWQHGFNSGVLAALRYAITFQENGKETADDWWPDLDT